MIFKQFHTPVKAFIKVARERFIILKNGSRTGYRCDPHNAVCSRICGTPVLSIGVVRNDTLKHGEIEHLQNKISVWFSFFKCH